MKVLRYVLVVVFVLAVIGGLGVIKGAQIKKLIDFGAQAKKDGPPPEAVSAQPAQSDTWEQTIEAVGTVASSKGVAITAEVPGKVTRIRFDSGQEVKAGAVLVELDTSVERAQLASLQARRKLARTNLKRTEVLRTGGAVAASRLDADQSNLQSLQADVGALQAQIAKKVIRAPFSGRLGIRNVDIGEYLQPGQAVSVLESVDGVFVDFTLPQQNLGRLEEGMPVRARLEGSTAPPREGTIEAIDPNVDPVTRSIQLRASLRGGEGALRPGMFVEVEVVLPEKKNVVMVPATAVVHAPYGDSVFVVEEKPADSEGIRETKDGTTVKVARQQFVRGGSARGDFVEIVEGVKVGQQVVVSGAFKLRNNAPVVVSDTVAIAPELKPSPPDR